MYVNEELIVNVWSMPLSFLFVLLVFFNGHYGRKRKLIVSSHVRYSLMLTNVFIVLFITIVLYICLHVEYKNTYLLTYLQNYSVT